MSIWLERKVERVCFTFFCVLKQFATLFHTNDVKIAYAAKYGKTNISFSNDIIPSTYYK